MLFNAKSPWVLVLVASQTLAATGHQIEEEIIVSAPFRKNSAETALPVNSLSGEGLHEVVSNSLGETLESLPGVTNASFGTGVGQPVIRGQSGNRVQVLQNSLNVVDASAVSPDHANGVEPVLAEKIEVIRGPATLLYGNGAIGGIVNVLDGRIPESSIDTPSFTFEQSHNSVNDEDKTIVRFKASAGNFNFYVDGTTRESNDVDIPDHAINPLALVNDEPDEYEDKIRGTDGHIANSDTEADSYTFGSSLANDNGFIGLSTSRLTSEYGLPPGVHALHQEEQQGEGSEQLIRLDLEQKRHDLAFGYRFDDGFIENIRGAVNITDYEHTELEIEDGMASTGTVFGNESIESRFSLRHAAINGWTGVFGVQFSDGEFSAIGEEAYIPLTDTRSTALFGVENRAFGNLTVEAGFRWEKVALELGQCDRDETTLSLSASVLADINTSNNVLVALSHSERAATLEERYSNIGAATCRAAADFEALVLHAATGRFEIGDPDLDTETSNNLELGWRRFADDWSLEVNLYYNQIDDYIYLQDSDIKVDEQVVSFYSSGDSSFHGLEASIERQLFSNIDHQVVLSLTADYVDAGLDEGGNLPRIPPARISAGISWVHDHWSVKLNAVHAFDQGDSGANELESDSYTNLSLYADYHFNLGAGELRLFARGTNLLDEEIRNHTSVLKNFAPAPGRAIKVGFRFAY